MDDASRHNRVLPIGGPGLAITPREQREGLFALLGHAPRFRQVPVAPLDLTVGVLAWAGTVVPALREKAEFARIGRYYTTESMLVLDPATSRYDPDATPSTGSETLFDLYAELVGGARVAERGDHAMFWPRGRKRNRRTLAESPLRSDGLTPMKITQEHDEIRRTMKKFIEAGVNQFALFTQSQHSIHAQSTCRSVNIIRLA